MGEQVTKSKEETYLDDIRAIKGHSAWKRFEEHIKSDFERLSTRVAVNHLDDKTEEQLKDQCRAYYVLLNMEKSAEKAIKKQTETNIKKQAVAWAEISPC